MLSFCGVVFAIVVSTLVGTSAAQAQAAAQTNNATPPAAYHASESVLASYDGQYRYVDEDQSTFISFFPGEPETDFSLSHENGDVYIEGPRTPRARLRQTADYDLSSPSSTVHYQLQHDAAGRVTGWVRIIVNSPQEPAQTSDPTQRRAAKISNTPLTYTFPAYQRSEAMIPVRDGVKLHVVILRPDPQEKIAAGNLPILLMRTPYGVDEMNSRRLNARYTELARSGYIFVFADIRGRYGSEGKFVMNRPVIHVFGNRTDPKLIDESSDTYDTVDWLVHNLSGNNGRVGVMGISYDGYTAMMAGIDPHPAVRALSPQAPMTNIWLGDDFFHNGAFRQSYGYDYVAGMESSKTDDFGKLKEDAFDYFLHAGNFENAARQGGIEGLPTAKEFIAHPEYNEFWRKMAVEPHLSAAEMPTPLPTLEVGGWWDQEDMWGPQAEYAALKPHDALHHVYLVLGPWRHGGWGGSTAQLGHLDFGEVTTDEFRARYEAPFFAHYLKDTPGFDLRDTASFQTGSNHWMQYDAWPPKKNIAVKKLFLQPGGTLSFSQPLKSAGDPFREYVADPADPVPYRHRPIQAAYSGGSQWYTWMVEDQRFVTSRPDLTTWSTPPLDHDVTITGDVVADLFAATTGSDADWVVKLIDVYPPNNGAMSGFQLMINGEIFRGRYRESFENPQPITPNTVEEYKYSLHGADHVFLKGHRIMVEVQSSWFPLYDRNPQTFVKNIMTAKPSAYQKETERIYGTQQFPSSIELPVVDAK